MHIIIRCSSVLRCTVCKCCLPQSRARRNATGDYREFSHLPFLASSDFCHAGCHSIFTRQDRPTKDASAAAHHGVALLLRAPESSAAESSGLLPATCMYTKTERQAGREEERERNRQRAESRETGLTVRYAQTQTFPIHCRYFQASFNIGCP